MSPSLTVHQASASYDVFVERGSIDRIGTLVAPRGSVFVVTSSALRLYGERVARSFNPQAALIEMEEGESHKTIETVHSIVTALLDHGAKRDALVVATGGGMIGDTAGFAASIFMRGVDVVQVPTTLLAMVDSSIGGKVGVNHPKGKNLLGSFHPPRAVVTDPSVLETLPERDYRSGLFEALKGGVIADPALFALFEECREALLARDAATLDEVIRRKVRVKAEIVGADERESGVRRLLNYGHTVGHGIEAAERYAGVTHGEAVGWGMIAANAIAVRRGLLDAGEARRIDDAIRALQPPAPRSAGLAEVLEAAGHDKKNSAVRRVMVLPRRIGTCEVVDDITGEELELAVRAVLPSA